MSANVLEERSVVLRLEFSIADAVHQRGLLPVIASAFVAWWNRPRITDVPAYLRADVGLPPLDEPIQWHLVPPVLTLPDAARKRQR